MTSYRRRLEGDLDQWIASGLVAAENREVILATIPQSRRLDAATALAAIGAFLAGAAIIAFIAANWGAIPRLVRFAMILAAFLAAAVAGAWAAGRERIVTKNVLLSLAAMIFAAAIGLTGQIFDIAGDEASALRAAGLAAALLAIAGRAAWPAAAAIGFVLAGDLAAGLGGARGEGSALWWAVGAAPGGAALALLWRSRPLARAAGLAAIVAAFTPPWPPEDLMRERLLLTAALFAGLAALARAHRHRFDGVTAEFYAWSVAGGLICFAAAGLGGGAFGVAHAILWLALSAAVTTLGRHDSDGRVTALGVLSLFAAGAALLFNLGVGLLTSAAVFAGCGLAALAIALVLRRSRTA
jgi:uncharacterized membrane protein